MDALAGTRIGIVGPGRLGGSLAAALVEAGPGPVWLAGRSPERVARMAREIGAAAADSPEALAREADLVFLCVPDSAIERVAGGLPWREGQWAVHCSGALGTGVLAPATRAGALTGCLHPIQTFPQPGEAARFRGITCGVEGPEPLGGALESLAGAIGAGSVRLEGVDRARYHAAAVFASNDVVALMAAAVRTWASAGLPEAAAREALAPLMLGAARSISGRELIDALTGPVARGDAGTVEGHLAALEGEPELAELYRALARELLRLPLDHDAETQARLVRLVGGGTDLLDGDQFV